MLLFVLAAVAAQEAAVPTPDPADRPPMVRRFPARPGEPIASLDSRRCADLLQRVSPGSLAAPLGRTGEGRVRMYRLLDRRIDGCPAPLVVSHDLPEANAARGRNLADGRAPAF